ncbi:Chorismate mutase I [Labilithrix luteola]|uniref:Bifunctional chorismate mutase/prephenate dehydratase n=1 Tax=Labilithrix luteola TaxID=1391654 RepID=A0A0K1QB08_9BACT|nr:Chorismate mutase I [Labilithrix luteola]
MLAGARARIDALDDEILDLLEKRADIAREIAVAKQKAKIESFHDPERERQVLERLAHRGEGRFPPDAVRAVFREVMSACLSVEQPLRVAYLGPEGTFSQMAARHLFGLSARYRECATIDAVFDAVQSRDATYGVVPIENSTEGAVSMTSDALLDGQLLIRQEYILPVSHCLLTRASSLSAIDTVYSHPQALAQCRLWIAKHLPRAQVVQTTSTAAAAREAQADDRAAAIGAAIASEIHDVPILSRNIQDRPENATRFVVLGHDDAKPSGRDRTTLAFGVTHHEGALRRVLTEFETAGVNLTRIESRPSRQKAWQYVFLVDVEGHRDSPELAKALKGARHSATFVKVIGSYPRSDPPAPKGKPSPKTRGRKGKG